MIGCFVLPSSSSLVSGGKIDGGLIEKQLVKGRVQAINKPLEIGLPPVDAVAAPVDASSLVPESFHFNCLEVGHVD